ncbi:MAG: hypothetical protein J6T84_04270 [Spirochaetaceae bacterium]|nr:hypothetical protein [Spirochaetaceae bacterium]
MKRTFITLIICLSLTHGLFSEEIQLYGSYKNYDLFGRLSPEDQYTSIINSFKGIRDSRQVNKWVIRMVEKSGREILPYVNKTLLIADFDHENREPIDTTLSLHYYIFNELIEKNLLTEEERLLYIIIIKGKIKEYILKYRVIDGTVRFAYRVLNKLNYSWSKEEYIDSEILKQYYEKELGITGIVAGSVESVFKITESPLAEYITD